MSNAACQFHRSVVVFSGWLAWVRAAGQWVLLQGGWELLVLGSLLSSCSAGMQGGEASPFLTSGYQERCQGQRAAAGAGAHSHPFQAARRRLPSSSSNAPDSSPLHFLHFIPSLLKISKCSSFQSWRGVTLIHEDEVKVRPSLHNLF